MIEPELLEILCCPETRQPVREATPEQLAELNRRIAKGLIKTRNGQPISQAMDEVLLRADGLVAYKVRERIPIMLMEEAVILDEPLG